MQRATERYGQEPENEEVRDNIIPGRKLKEFAYRATKLFSELALQSSISLKISRMHRDSLGSCVRS